MSTNKNAQIRYLILDNCFRNTGRRYFIEDLISECNKKLQEIDPEFKGISRRQIFDDINFMESSEGWSIDLLREKGGKKVFYHYADPAFSINNMPLNEIEITRLQSTLQLISQFKGMPQFEWMAELLPKLKQNASADSEVIMEFESNVYLNGLDKIGIIYNTITYKKVLKINYLPHTCEASFDVIIHPYYLKQYNNRWFLLGYNPLPDRYNWNLALDRIQDIKELDAEFIPNTEINWQDYFEDIIGVTTPFGQTTEKIILHFYGKTAYYMLSKPIHGSQKAKWIDKEILEIQLELMVNYEFEQFILSYADSIKVIQPQSLADKIKSRLSNGYNLYI
ncbi:MAG: WYL domain-containing protein [Candidatus Symbiothrix sp.]|jgi:predicted DNA-binding transcriptional regulator YafY|nr:WYL domain-containing protein [Candidatus Symbiothrix sp.]